MSAFWHKVHSIQWIFVLLGTAILLLEYNVEKIQQIIGYFFIILAIALLVELIAVSIYHQSPEATV